MRRIAFLLVALVGCAPQTSGDDPTCTDVFFADTDGDQHGDAGAATTACSAPSGYVATDDDCDDSDGSIHPGADEVCNGLDDDCDARIDVDAIDEQTWYADADLDGFGDEATAATACAHPEGYISVAGDCADDDAEVNPDADELCNDIDDDCDELVDSLDPSLVQGTVWYADADADGYGDPATGAHACEPPVGKITDGTDCDDADPAVHPAVDEMCNDKDDDCDGLVDGDDDGLVDGLPFYADADGDGLGDGAAVVTDCSVPTGYVDNSEDCDDGDATVGASPDYYEDNDGDGYGDGAPVHTCTPTASQVTVDGDCRDSNADINPGATETCDSRDNNCDGLVDEDDPLVVVSTTWYADGDGDGYGDPLDTLTACEASAGYVRSSTDCDDADAELHPGATEYCDGVDNDCDGTMDDSVVYSDWYPDDDGDGYGVTDDPKNDCVAPSGYIAVGGDCDDKSSSTHPGATEICANEVDEDCNTDVDDCQISVALADFMAVGSPWAWFGTDLDVADADADGVSDLLVGSFEDSLYVVYGPASGSTTTASLVALSPDTTIPSFGSAVGAGDSNDDGVDDVLAGSSSTLGDGTSYLFLGPITADRGTTDADAVMAGPSDSLAGCYVDVVGDFDGDGASDVVIGAPGDTGVLATVYVATGPTSGAIDLAADAAYVYEGASADSDLGGVVQHVGDMNADGIDDLALEDWIGPGTVYLIDGGSASGTYAVDVAASASLVGERDSGFGSSMKSVDYDADGTLDLVIGALTSDAPFGLDASGAVYAFLGPLSGSLDGRDAAVVWRPYETVDRLGSDIAVGDVDGDESPDLLLGAIWSEDYGGKAFLQLGPASGVVEVDGLPSFDGDLGEYLGSSVAIVPDWTGDGRDEVALAAGYHRNAAGEIEGAVYAFDSETIFGP